MSALDLQETLARHKAWLDGEEGGVRANLSNANLRKADLSDTDLRYANLNNADLRYADLRYANLSNADLGYADLRYADLRDANLSYLGLADTDLRDADLRGAYLHNTDLRGATLSGARPSWVSQGNQEQKGGRGSVPSNRPGSRRVILTVSWRPGADEIQRPLTVPAGQDPSRWCEELLLDIVRDELTWSYTDVDVEA